MKRWMIQSAIGLGVPLLGAAILFPVFGNARENARRSSCGSNLKQIGLGIAQYSQDYNNRMPLVRVSDHPTVLPSTAKIPTPFGWADSLQPYLKSTCIFQCPSDTFAPEFKTKGGGYSDYFFNAQMSGARRKNPRAAHVVLGGDGIGDARSSARYALSNPPDQKTVSSGYGGGPLNAWKHRGQANFLFVDGHVKALSPSEVSARRGAAFTFSPF